MADLVFTPAVFTFTGGEIDTYPIRFTAAAFTFTGGSIGAGIDITTSDAAATPLLDRLTRNPDKADGETEAQFQRRQLIWQQTMEAIEAAFAAVGVQITDIATLIEAILAAMDAAQAALAQAQATEREQNLVNSTTSPLVTLSAASDGTIAIAAHDRIYGDGTTVAVDSGSVSGQTPRDYVGVYYIDPAREGGAVAFLATTAVLTQGADTHVVGFVTIPEMGEADYSGSGAGPPGWKFADDLDPGGTGSADIADTLTTARNFSITGGVTAPVISFDGSGNVALDATVVTNANLTGVVTSTGNATAIADNALSIAKTSGLQTALDAKQPLDSDLTTIAGLTATTDNFMVASGSAWASRTPAQAIAHLGLDADIASLSLPASTTISAFGATLIDDAAATNARTTLGLAIGTDVQAYDADLAGIAALSFSQGDILYRDGSGLQRLAAGTAGQRLETAGAAANPSWAWSDVQVLAQSAVQVSHTGNTSETTLADISIPAGTMGANDQLRITGMFTYTNSANTKTIKVKLDTTNFRTFAPTTTATLSFLTSISNRNSVSSQIGENAGQVAPNVANANAPITGAIDMSSTQSLKLTGQLANSGETVSLEWYRVELLRAPA